MHKSEPVGAGLTMLEVITLKDALRPSSMFRGASSFRRGFGIAGITMS
jgi:hypothetical protein